MTSTNFEDEWVDYLRREQDGLLSGIRETGKLGDDTEAALVDAMKAFKDEFTPDDSAEVSVGSNEDEGQTEAMGDHEVDQEQITVQRS